MILVSAQVLAFGLDFGTLDFGLGLDNKVLFVPSPIDYLENAGYRLPLTTMIICLVAPAPGDGRDVL